MRSTIEPTNQPAFSVRPVTITKLPLRHGQTVDVNAPLPPEKEPTEAEAEQYLQVLKEAMRLQMYFPQARTDDGLAVFHELAKRNESIPKLP